MRTPTTAGAIVSIDGALLAAFAAVLLSIGGATLSATTILWLLFGGSIVVVAGAVILTLTLGPSMAASNILAILIGAIATSMFLLAGCYATGLHAGSIFLCWSILVASAALMARTRLIPQLASIDRFDIAVLAVMAVVVALWCHRTAGALPTLNATGIAATWSDYSIHGTEIAQFGDPHARGLTSFLLADQPLVFYHYGPYMLAAAVNAVVDLAPWGLAASFLLPCGILLMVLAVYAFVRTQSSAGLALVTALALILLPDASTYWFKNGFFGFDWLLFTAPGSGYGIAVAFTALAILAASTLDARSKGLWLGLLVAASLLEFRAHILLVFAPAVSVTLFCETAFARRHARAIALAVVVVCALVVATVTMSHRVRNAWLEFSALQRFMDVVHGGMAPTAYDGVYLRMKQQLGTPIANTLGVVALLPVTLGWMSIALPVVAVVAMRRRTWQRFDFFPAWCIVAWLGIVLVAPTAGGRDNTEYQHRPFVFVYAVALVWTAVFLDRAVRVTEPVGVARRLVLPATLAAAATIAGVGMWNQDRARPRFAWGANNFAVPVDRGVIDAASFIRAHATYGDTFAVIPTEPFVMLDDQATRLAALAGVPAYLARAGIQVRNGEYRRVVVEQRLAELSEVQTTSDADSAMRTLRKTGVDFLVSLGSSCPRFDPSCAAAAFRGSGAVVYKVEGQ